MPNYDITDRMTTELTANKLFRPTGLTSGNMVHKWVDVGDALKDEVALGGTDNCLQAYMTTNMKIADGFALVASAGDYARWRVPLKGVDLTQDIYITPMFTHLSTDADTPIFKFHYATTAFAGFNEAAVPASAAHPVVTGTTITYAAITTSTDSGDIHWVQPVDGGGIIPGKYLPKAPYLYCALEADDLGSASTLEIGIGGFVMSYRPSFASQNLQ